MLLYLSSNENIGIFDFLSNEKGMVIKKLSGEFYLKKFVIHDMRNLSHYSYFVIDLKAIKDLQSELIEALTAFKTLYDSRIIIFAEGISEENEIITKLLNEKIYNIITSEEIAEIKDEILKCISEEGKTLNDWSSLKSIGIGSEETFENKYIFNHKNIKIAVAGVSSKVGTTTTAFNLARFLHDKQAKVSYTEANSSGHLKQIAAYYEFSNAENYFKYNGIEYYPDKQFPEDNNFNVFDLGSLSLGNLSIFKSFDIKVLCCGSKPYELSDIPMALNLLDNINLNILLSLASEDEEGRISKMFDDSKDKIYFQKYTPSMFDGKTNEKIYKELIKDYATEI